MSNLHETSHWICVKRSESYLENSSDFKYCFGLEVEATVEPSWPIFAALAFASRNCSVAPEVEGHSSAESTNFTLFCNSGGYLLRLQTLYNFTYKSSRLSRCRKRFSWKYSENSDCRASSVETMKIWLYAQARRLPLLQAQSSVWNRLSFLNSFLMFLHKFKEIFRVNWTWISDCRASSILKVVPVSEDSKENALCKHEKFMH